MKKTKLLMATVLVASVLGFAGCKTTKVAGSGIKGKQKKVKNQKNYHRLLQARSNIIIQKK